jgi:hypothetical protein
LPTESSSSACRPNRVTRSFGCQSG